MAKKSSIEKNARRRKMAKSFSGRRAKLKAIARDKALPMEDRFAAALSACAIAAQFVADADPQPLRNHRPTAGFYRKLKMSRIALRELGSKGLIPGMVKSSW